MYCRPDFLTGIISEVNWICGQVGGGERTSTGRGGVQNVGYNSHLLSPVGCTRQTGPDLCACSPW